MWKLIPLSIIQALFLSGGQVMLKLALAAAGPYSNTWAFYRKQLTNWWFHGCGISFCIATILWFYILRNYPFSIAYPLSSLSYFFGMLAAMLIFHEPVAWTQWLGVLFIMAGCALLTK